MPAQTACNVFAMQMQTIANLSQIALGYPTNCVELFMVNIISLRMRTYHCIQNTLLLKIDYGKRLVLEVCNITRYVLEYLSCADVDSYNRKQELTRVSVAFQVRFYCITRFA